MGKKYGKPIKEVDGIPRLGNAVQRRFWQ